MSYKRFLILIILFSLNLWMLSGCATTRQPLDIQLTGLMPESVAKKILAKYVEADWIEQPYARSDNVLCVFKKTSISYNEIGSVVLNRSFHSLYLYVNKSSSFCNPFYYSISDVDSDKAKEIGTALKALGSPISIVSEVL